MQHADDAIRCADIRWTPCQPYASLTTLQMAQSRFSGWPAAWMIDHDIRSYRMIARAFDGKAGRADAGRHPRQRHALTGCDTAISSARLYWDTQQ